MFCWNALGPQIASERVENMAAIDQLENGLAALEQELANHIKEAKRKGYPLDATATEALPSRQVPFSGGYTTRSGLQPGGWGEGTFTGSQGHSGASARGRGRSRLAERGRIYTSGSPIRDMYKRGLPFFRKVCRTARYSLYCDHQRRRYSTLLLVPSDSSEDSLLLMLQTLEEPHVLLIGQLHEDIVGIWTTLVEDNRNVVLTAKCRLHYLERHPEIAGHEPTLCAALLDPDEIHRNKKDWQMGIFYKKLEDGEHYLRVAVCMQESPGRQKHSVLSARIAGEEGGYRRGG